MNTLRGSESKKEWNSLWEKYLAVYLKAPPRLGYWISSYFPPPLSVLEIAAGSACDSLFLARQGYRTLATDNNEWVVEKVSEKFSHLSDFTYLVENAFSFSFPDRVVDLSFSNGFWVLFSDDELLRSLAREQARVTGKYMVVVVHNIENKKLVNTFKEKAVSDPLYDVRFFSREELVEIIKTSGIPARSIRVEKFGGIVDVFFNPRIKGVYNPFSSLAPRVIPRLYRFLPWNRVERVVCVVELA